MKRLALAFTCLLTVAAAVPADVTTVGTGNKTASLFVQFEDRSFHEFQYRFDGSITGEDLLTELDARTDLAVQLQDYGFGYFVNAMSYQGHSNGLYRGGEDWWHYWNRPAGGEWSASWVGISDRVLDDGDADGFVYGYADAPGALPEANFNDSFTAPPGTLAQSLGYEVHSQMNAGAKASVATDPTDASNQALLLHADEGDVAISNEWTVPLAPQLDIALRYLFDTTGKLEVLVDGAVIDTIVAPTEGPGSPGSGVWAQYERTIDVTAGSTMSFEVRLSNDGDPDVYIDDLSVTPEPTTLALLALGALPVIRRRKR
ncbi:MAG: PEP-CTERM sorting domain-containing protein [Phycisphaerae bacterium]